MKQYQQLEQKTYHKYTIFEPSELKSLTRIERFFF